MRILLAAFIVVQLVGCKGPYEDLESSFKSDRSLSESTIPVKTVTFTSTKRTRFVRQDNEIRVKLSSDAIAFELPSVFGLSTRRLRIPATAVSACSKTCYGDGSWDADLLIESPGTEISFSSAKDILDWCWSNRIPMASASSRGQWLYNHAKLPAKNAYSEQLASRDRYDKQMEMSCMGN